VKEVKKAMSTGEASKVGLISRHMVASADLLAGRTLKEVCRDRPAGWKVWQAELSMFKGWGASAGEQSEVEGK
jgi:hypothetical protein